VGHFVGYSMIADGILPGDVNTSNDDANFPGINALDWAPYLVWRTDSAVTSARVRVNFATPKTVDAVGIAFHNVGTLAGRVRWQYSDDGVNWTTYLTVSPTDDSVIFRPGLTPQSATNWRCIIDSMNGLLEVGHIFWGTALDMGRGPDPGFIRPRYAYAADVRNSQAFGGGFLARTKIEREYGKSVLSRAFSTTAWTAANFAALWEHAQTKPFYWAWDTTNNPDDTAFAFADGTPPPIEDRDGLYNDLTIPVLTYR
jgi:hypothetical protein